MLDPHRQATTAIRPLEATGVTVIRPTSGDLAETHGLFLDEPAAGRIRHKSQAPLRPTALSSATLVSTWGRLRATKLRLLTVNHGNQRTAGTAAQQPYRP